jgi:hypothetical protein
MTDSTSRTPQPTSPLFPLGRVVITTNAADRLASFAVEPSELIARHAVGDWGDLDPEDVQENRFSLDKQLRLLSSYPVCDGADEGCRDHRIWIITEADRSLTTLLRPEDY